MEYTAGYLLAFKRYSCNVIAKEIMIQKDLYLFWN
jgi:hypothetical protein